MVRNRYSIGRVHFKDTQEEAAPKRGEVGDLIKPSTHEHEVDEVCLTQIREDVHQNFIG